MTEVAPGAHRPLGGLPGRASPRRYDRDVVDAVAVTHTVYVLRGGPNWAEICTAIGSILASLGVGAVLIGALAEKNALRATLEQVKLAAKQVEEAEKVRTVSLAVEMARRWDDDAIVKARREMKPLDAAAFRRAYEPARDKNTEQYFEWLKLANYFEDFGALVEMNCLDLDLVDRTIGNAVVFYWEKWAEPLLDERAKEKDLYDNWQRLAENIKGRRAGGDVGP